MPRDIRLQSDMLNNMSLAQRRAMMQRGMIWQNEQIGAFEGEEVAPAYAQAQREYWNDQRQAQLNYQRFRYGQMAKQQQLQNQLAYRNYVQQQEEQQNQQEAQKLSKLISDLQDSNSQAHQELSPVERINQINRARAKLAGIGAGPSRVHIEEVDNGLT